MSMSQNLPTGSHSRQPPPRVPQIGKRGGSSELGALQVGRPLATRVAPPSTVHSAHSARSHSRDRHIQFFNNYNRCFLLVNSLVTRDFTYLMGGTAGSKW